MNQNNILHGILINDAGDARQESQDTCVLSLNELARACAVEPDWVVEHIESGVLGDGSRYVASYRFTSYDLKRARRVRQLERDFDAVPELAAMFVDLVEEVEQLKKHGR